MKSKMPELTQRYLVLIKLDARNLFNRIHLRHDQYLEVFSSKRDRRIFKEIFENRYSKCLFSDLSHLPVEIIEIANEFYQASEDLYWYLKYTQDMPNTIEDEIIRKTHFIGKRLEILNLYIDAELSGSSMQDIQDPKKNPGNSLEEDFFISQGELSSIDEELKTQKLNSSDS